jgi:hypothetical protein
MKLLCKGKYHNQPHGMHFDGPGVIDIDDDKARFLLRDAPENFEVAVERKPEPAPVPVIVETEAFDAPPADKMVKTSRKKGV